MILNKPSMFPWDKFCQSNSTWRFKICYCLLTYQSILNVFNLVWPTRAATAGSHFQHIPDGDAAQNRPVRSLQRIVREVPGRSLFGHVYVIDDHNDHADRAYWQCYRQGHFPGDPCRVVTARRHFWRDAIQLLFVCGKHRRRNVNFNRGVHHAQMMPYAIRHYASGIQLVTRILPDACRVLRLKVRGQITWMRKIVSNAALLCNIAKNLLFKCCPLLSMIT